MDVGIFAKVFVRSSLDGVLEAIASNSIRHVQFNMACAGLPSLPDAIPSNTIEEIRRGFAVNGLTMSAMSGTYNLIDQDRNRRETNKQRLRLLARTCNTLSTPLITLCTGTRDASNMWKAHPDNDSADAWSDMLHEMHDILDLTEESGVCLGVEPELSNVINSARKARKLLDAMRSPRIKIVMDGSNLLHTGQVHQMNVILTEAIDLLGADVALVHAKDLMHDGGHGAAGTGMLNYDLYLALLARIGYSGPLVLHTLLETQVAQSVEFIRGKLASNNA